MNIFKWMGEIIDYLAEGATALFSPNRDQDPPKIGVQPFNGDPYSEWVSSSDHETK